MDIPSVKTGQQLYIINNIMNVLIIMSGVQQLTFQPTNQPTNHLARCVGSNSHNCEPGVVATLNTPGDLGSTVTACADGIASPIPFFVSQVPLPAMPCRALSDTPVPAFVVCSTLVDGSKVLWRPYPCPPCCSP